jgi:hypothetical protein
MAGRVDSFWGWPAGRISFYPPILFVLGIGAMIGAFRGEE